MYNIPFYHHIFRKLLKRSSFTFNNPARPCFNLAKFIRGISFDNNSTSVENFWNRSLNLFRYSCLVLMTSLNCNTELNLKMLQFTFFLKKSSIYFKFLTYSKERVALRFSLKYKFNLPASFSSYFSALLYILYYMFWLLLTWNMIEEHIGNLCYTIISFTSEMVTLF